MKVLIADDQLIFAEATAALLARNGHEVFACGAGAEQIMRIMPEMSPDAALVGLDFDGHRCAEIGELARSGLGVFVVAMSPSTDAGLLARALDVGADAVFLKTEGIDELERLLAELKTRSSGLGGKHWSRGANAARHPTRLHGVLAMTLREREVLSLLARGESTSRVATSLGVGTATVRTHVQNLFFKSGTHSRLELLAQARRTGLLTMVPEPARQPAEPTGMPAEQLG